MMPRSPLSSHHAATPKDFNMPTTALPALDPQTLQVLAFDIFGTVVDWHASIAREMQQHYPHVDGDAFALAWRAGYAPAMARVMSGEQPWTLIDDLHRQILDSILPDFGLAHLGNEERAHLNRVWRRLAAWPDVVAALMRLKIKYILCTLSNGNLNLLTRLSKQAALPWDCILSAETFQAYKPDPRTYGGVARVFKVEPWEVLMVATHHDDLAAARACGLRTAYIERPLELGAKHPKDGRRQAGNDLHARDLLALADLLGC
jgi:2-haloacid dehalogenase